MFKEFKEFAVRGNVIDLAVAVIIGAAFGKIVDSLVKDVIMPPLGKITGNVDFTDLFINLGPGTYDSLAAAKQAGAATVNYGVFINNVVTFVLVALAVFILVRGMNRLRRRLEAGEPDPSPSTKNCPYCVTSVPIKATRCPACTSQLESPS